MRAWRLLSAWLCARLRAAENDTPTVGRVVQTHASLCHLAAWIAQSDPRRISGYSACSQAGHSETHSRFIVRHTESPETNCSLLNRMSYITYNHEYQKKLKTAFIGCGGHA